MNPMLILKLSQSRFVRAMDFLLPIIALCVAAWYYWAQMDNTQALIWLATAVVALVLSIANITKLMAKVLIPNKRTS